MSKIINISEDKHKKALREIFKEELMGFEHPEYDPSSNREPFGNHDQIYNDVNDQETVDTPDGNMNIENPELP